MSTDTTENLLKQYTQLRPEPSTLYVVPLIRHSQPDTDYLYNLYRPFLDPQNDKTSTLRVQSLSVFSHGKFVWDQLLGRPVVLHYHWLECQDLKGAAGMIWKLSCLFIYKLLGGKLVWTIHNKHPHRGKWLALNYRIRRWMARKADKLHVHCESVVSMLGDFFKVPEQKFFVRSHPSFKTHKMDRDQALMALDHTYALTFRPEERLFLVFGNIARYKRIEEIISIFNDVPELNHLLIAGRVKKGNRRYYRSLQQMAKDRENIHLLDQYIPEKNIPYFFNSVDYLVYNHRNVIASGVVELAKNYQCNIIAPREGCIKEEEDAGHLQLFDSSEELEKIIRSTSLNNEQ